jgi:hypothetical protein
MSYPVAYKWHITASPVTRSSVTRLQDELLKMPQADIKTAHIFKPGIYERTITIPPWTVLTGAAHKTPYRVRLDKGTIAVNTDGGVKTLTAPCEFDAPAGVQRAGRVFGDEVVWTDIYVNEDNCQDLSELERRLYEVPACGLGDARARDRLDFERFREQLGLTKPELDAIVQIDHDLIDMPPGHEVECRPSLLHGFGLFALRSFEPGEVICPGRLNGKRTPAGRFTNHSLNPNAKPVKMGDDIYAVAVRQIAAEEEVLINYRESMLVNFGIEMQEASCLDG